MKPMLHPAIEDITLPCIFYALGDPVRFQIVQNLYEAKDALICIDAVKGIENLPLSTRSHSFRVLRESGLIRSEKQGRECYNTLRYDELEQKFPGLLKATLSHQKT